MLAIEAARRIDFQELSEVCLPDISGFSAAVKTVLKLFFRKAYDTPYFMLHTTFSSNVPGDVAKRVKTVRSPACATDVTARQMGLLPSPRAIPNSGKDMQTVKIN